MVFTDLERGAVAVVKSMGKETSKTVGHKYGEDAGKVTDDSMTAAAHGVNLAYVRRSSSSILLILGYMYICVGSHKIVVNIIKYFL